jgi:hypothetical protein
MHIKMSQVTIYPTNEIGITGGYRGPDGIAFTHRTTIQGAPVFRANHSGTGTLGNFTRTVIATVIDDQDFLNVTSANQRLSNIHHDLFNR